MDWKRQTKDSATFFGAYAAILFLLIGTVPLAIAIGGEALGFIAVLALGLGIGIFATESGL